MTGTFDRALLQIISGARNGAIYGAKVRFVHAIATAALFGKRPWSDRLTRVLKLTVMHAWALARFVALYKAVSMLVKWAVPGSTPAAASFVAGAAGGWLVFGKSREAVAEQMVLYVMSRAIMGAARAATKGTKLSSPRAKAQAWQATSALMWGLVMALFTVDQDSLNLTLARSMEYLYIQSNDITGFLDLFNY